MNSQNKPARVVVIFSLLLLLMTGLRGNSAGMSLFHDDIAIKGYDPVAYFEVGKALQGNKTFTFKWHDMTWYFVSKENLDVFAADPEKYAPQYDGYCAWAMTEAQKAQTDPEVWKIVGGKLYLNCSRSTYEKWIKDIPGNIKKADLNWSKIKDKN